MYRIFAALVLALGIASCAGYQPQQTIAGLESGLTIAERSALAYVKLTPCSPGLSANLVCADPAIVAKIKAADNTAYNAIKAAQAQLAAGQTPDFAAAGAALGAFQAIVTDPAVATLIKGN